LAKTQRDLTRSGEISPNPVSSHQIWQPNSSARQKPKTRKRVRVESGFERRRGGGDRRDVWRWRSDHAGGGDSQQRFPFVKLKRK
jgi:hypothetical protein